MQSPSQYAKYFQENMTKIQRENPHLSFTNVSRIISNNWMKLPEGERNRYKISSKEKTILKEYLEKRETIVKEDGWIIV